MTTHMEMVLRAAAFAAEKHRNQRRKDEEASPYINHPIQLAYILVQADVSDPVVLAAALLHDTIEDTNTTQDELEIVFGHEIANVVAECTDDKRLGKLERKQAQIDHAAGLSSRAKLVKLADKSRTSVTSMGRRRLAGHSSASASISTGRSGWSIASVARTRHLNGDSMTSTPNGPDGCRTSELECGLAGLA